MPNLRRPGTYIEEVLNPIAAPQESSSSTGVFIGEHFRGPTTAALLRSWTDFVKLFGGFPPSGSPVTDFPFGVYEFFANGGRECWCARTLGTDAARATLTVVDRADTPVNTLTINALNEGAWGNLIKISILTRDDVNGRFDLVVFFGGTTDQFRVERFNDLSMEPADARFVEKVVNSPTSGSAYIVAGNLASDTVAPGNMPAVVTTVTLASGADGDAANTSQRTAAVSAGGTLDVIEGNVIVNLPGETNAAVLGALIGYAEDRGAMFVVVDPSQGLSAAEAIDEATGLTASAYAAYYWPPLVAQDPTASAGRGVRTMPPGGFILGLIASTDARRGVFKAPAGYQARLNGVFTLEKRLTTADLDVLNDAHVNAIRQIPGQGTCVFGARTLASGRADMYVNVRRTLNYIRYNLTRSTEFALFEDNDEQLWAEVRSVATRFLGSLWSIGGLRGNSPDEAFYVKCDGELNTPTNIEEGKLTYEVGVALQFPAEFIIIRIGQWEGGQSVAEAA